MKSLNIWTKPNIDYWIARDIITYDDIAASDKEATMAKVLDNFHKYKITQATDGRWVTYIKDDTKPNGLRQIRRRSKADLYSFLIRLYGVCNDISKSIHDVFGEWVEYKETFTHATNPKKRLSPSTIHRYKNDYRRFVSGTVLDNESIDIDDMRLEQILISIINKKQPLDSAWTNFYGNLDGMFRYAVRKRYISSNPLDFIDKDVLRSFCVPDKVKDDSERIMTVEELQGLIQATYRQIDRHPGYMCNYAILMTCLIGLRAGELSALKWECIDDEYIHIVRAERRYDYDDHTEYVIGEPKNHKFRRIPITEDVRTLLNEIRLLSGDSEWLFPNSKGNRHTGHDITCAVDRRAKEAGLKGSSTHEVRRTVSSIMRTYASRETVAHIMGHLPETNDKFYDYDTTTYNDKVQILKNVAESYKVINFESYINTKKSEKAQ